MTTPPAKGMLFSAAMVRAMLNDTKTQTRRIVKPQPPEGEIYQIALDYWKVGKTEIKCPHPRGSLIWAKETHLFHATMAGPHVHYRADNAEQIFPDAPDCPAWLADDDKWRPSIFMPCWASRIARRVAKVRMEKLGDISEADALAEGIEYHQAVTARSQFAALHEAHYGPGSWERDKEKWTWVYELKKV